MDFYSLVEGPLLWVSLSALCVAVLGRTIVFLAAVVRSSQGRETPIGYDFMTFARLFVPFHMAAARKPWYAIPRYIFHACLFILPIWLAGHVALWEESRFEWSWLALPDAWSDGFTLAFLALATFLIIRRIAVKDVRQDSSFMDFIILAITTLPYLTGYFLTHGTLDHIPFLLNHMMVIHMLTGEAMILMAVVLFCRTRMDNRKCIGCASCEIACPTGTLASHDDSLLRHFDYSHYQCICCGSCVNVCPEDAAQLRHEISLKRLFQVVRRHEIRAVELRSCERCGARFAPEPQMEKVGKTFSDDYLRFCPNCRKANLGDMMYQWAPWAKGPARPAPLPRPDAEKKIDAA